MDKFNYLVKESLEEISKIGVKPSINIFSIELNKRAKRRLGCCKRIYLKGIQGFRVEISTRLMEHDERLIKEVIIHEILHTCAGCFNHGKQWKYYAGEMNKAYGYHISRTADITDANSTYKYEIRCKRCGNINYRMRRTKVVENPQNYKCGKCKGPLEVRRNEEILPVSERD